MTWGQAIREIMLPSDPRLQLMWLLAGIVLGFTIGPRFMDWWRRKR